MHSLTPARKRSLQKVKVIKAESHFKTFWGAFLQWRVLLIYQITSLATHLHHMITGTWAAQGRKIQNIKGLSPDVKSVVKDIMLTQALIEAEQGQNQKPKPQAQNRQGQNQKPKPQIQNKPGEVSSNFWLKPLKYLNSCQHNMFRIKTKPR